jgi:hypothetical protein
MEQKVSVNNTGIDSAGLTSDYMQAIAEFIWNGFDAGASQVAITFNPANNMEYIQSFQVSDNGEGIDLSTIEGTFGNFMDSLKKRSYQKSSSTIHGNKGKGRFSFVAFCGMATWHTIYRDKSSEKLLEYDIVVRRNSKDKFNYDNKVVSKSEDTGTIVTFTELFGVDGSSLSNKEFIEYLGYEFGWFLLLNKERQFNLSINGKAIPFQHLIAESDVREFCIPSDGGNFVFKATFVRWTRMIGDKFYFYFLDSQQKEVWKDLTSFNNNAMNFNHSVYIESAFFNSFAGEDQEQTLSLFTNTKYTGIFKPLMNALHQWVKEKQRNFVHGEAAEKLITAYERTGVIPKFNNNKYDQARRVDLIEVVKGIYSIEPKIFTGLNKEQQKVSVGLINVLLNTDERDTIIEIIGQIVILTPDERDELLHILRKTTIGKITKMVNLIQSRFRIIELLKTLVFDLKKFTSEITHLQKAIEDSYWLFGEQYHLVSANESFTVLQKKYLDFIAQLEKEDEKSAKPRGKGGSKVRKADFDRRPDVFLCGKLSIPDVGDHQYLMEENVMVELKRPTVVIGKAQLRQIEDYLEIVRTDDAFNSQKRCWKFFIVGNKIDDYVSGQYESQKEKGKKFLVKAAYNYEIFAFTWDDIFVLFRLRHQFLVDQIDFDKDAIKRELIEKGIDLTMNSAPDAVTAEVQAAV